MPKNRVTLKILLFLISTDILETFVQFCFKKTAIPESNLLIKNFGDLLVFIKSAAGNGYLWLGILSVGLTFIIWSTILSKIDLSIAVPIASSSYILVPLTSIIFLHEEVTFLDWSGILCILIGVIIVSKSTRKEELIMP
jgi:undecaprenyl phosphate-alpha-L-ara4N flippase subunit ArnE